MDILELLKKLKSVEPNRDYSRKSRMVILGRQGSRLPVFSFSFGEIATGVFRSGWAIALTAVLLLLTIGSFSFLKFISPATTAVVDLTGLRAEAQNIDTQIELANIVYNSSIISIENKTSTVSIILPRTKSPKAAVKREEIVSATDVESASAETTIDSALDALSR